MANPHVKISGISNRETVNVAMHGPSRNALAAVQAVTESEKL
jgi:hypothetical protein